MFLTNKYKIFAIIVFMFPLLPVILLFNLFNTYNNKPLINRSQIKISIENKITPTPTSQTATESQVVIKEEKRDTVSRGNSNRLHNININMDLREKSNLTIEEFDKALTGTKLEGLSKAYINAESIHGINALFIAGVSAHESGWGTSALAKNKNNLFGFQAYDNNVSSAKKFSNKEECIDYVAGYIARNYLNKNGRYHHGFTIGSINKSYASDQKWQFKVFNTMKEILKKIND
jgi:beta-N-acetylglucosaminidase